MTIQQRLSTLWIVVMFNMGFADILSFMSPEFLTQVATGTVEGVKITPIFLLIAAFFVEIPITMIYFSRVLKPKTNRIANLVAAFITIVFVVGGGSLKPHYIFFAGIEIITMLYIISLVWNWREN